MENLIKFYTQSILKVVGVVFAVSFIARTVVVPRLEMAYGKEHWSVFAASWLSSGAGVALVLGIAEWLIRKKLWKCFHPELDVSGLWIGNNTYTRVHVGNAPVGDVSGEHEVKIRQDCLSIQIEPSEGTQFGFWESKAINLIGKDKLVYAYEVRYKMGVPNRPEKAFGYEEMTLISSGQSRRPVRMKGEFYHCAAGQSPVFSGQVVFNRKIK